MNSLPGSHRAREERLSRPKPTFPGRHSTESAPPAFENETPHSHARVIFSETEEPQLGPDRRTGKGRADGVERPYQECKSQQPCTRARRVFLFPTNVVASSQYPYLLPLTCFTNSVLTCRRDQQTVAVRLKATSTPAAWDWPYSTYQCSAS